MVVRGAGMRGGRAGIQSKMGEILHFSIRTKLAIIIYQTNSMETLMPSKIKFPKVVVIFFLLFNIYFRKYILQIYSIQTKS